MGVKDGGKIWNILTKNEKKYKSHQQKIKNVINQNIHSKSSQKPISFTRKIIPLTTDDALNVIDRNIIIQRHSIFQKETHNAYNQHQLKNIYELLFKNEKDYHIQRKNVKTTGISSDSTPQPFMSYTNNINKTETSEYILQDLNSKANYSNNYCNMSYHKPKLIIPKNNLHKNNSRNHNIRQTFYSLLHTNMFSPHKDQSNDVIEFVDMDNELKQHNDNYLKSKIFLKLKKKYPFYKRNDIQNLNKPNNRSNVINTFTQYKRKNKSNSPRYNVVLNTYNSMQNITNKEQFIRHQQYIDELKQHFSNCPSKRYINFKNKTRRSCYNENESRSSRNIFDDVSNIKLNKVSQKTTVPKLKKILMRNVKINIDSNNSSK